MRDLSRIFQFVITILCLKNDTNMSDSPSGGATPFRRPISDSQAVIHQHLRIQTSSRKTYNYMRGYNKALLVTISQPIWSLFTKKTEFLFQCRKPRPLDTVRDRRLCRSVDAAHMILLKRVVPTTRTKEKTHESIPKTITDLMALQVMCCPT